MTSENREQVNVSLNHGNISLKSLEGVGLTTVTGSDVCVVLQCVTHLSPVRPDPVQRSGCAVQEADDLLEVVISDTP